MLRRLLYLALDHEAAVLRERNRELEEMVVSAREDTTTIVREQNQLIDRLHDQMNYLRGKLDDAGIRYGVTVDIKTGTHLDYLWTIADIDRIVKVLADVPVYMGDPTTTIRLILAKLRDHETFAKRLTSTLNDVTRELRLAFKRQS